MRTVAQSLVPRLLHGGAVKALLSKYSNRFTAYSSYPIELKLGKLILVIVRTIAGRRIFFDFPPVHCERAF